jgi:hypothetical protein
MSNASFALPAPRRFALSASRRLERWALKPERPEELRREAVAYEQSLADREQHARDALALNLLR